ncbi:MAG TPA: hypothetical protein VJL89_01810 [Thermodesulfovibrionia bacterium]|nr:hypothetical protein [Thermodesulfovibrionia bacterium]
MKKYNIILTDLSNRSQESKQILYESFAKEFAISVSGAAIMLKHLPTLLEIDVDDNRAKKYVDFFNKFGGHVDLKERKRDAETLPPIPVEELVTEFEPVDEGQDSVYEEHEEIHLPETESPLAQEDDFIPATEELKLDENYESKPAVQSDTAKPAPYNKPDDVGLAMDKVKAEFMKNVSGDELADDEIISDYSTFVVEGDESGLDSDEGGVFQCPSCGFTVETPQETCPLCSTPMVQEKPGAQKEKALKPSAEKPSAQAPGLKPFQKPFPFVIVAPPPPPYSSWKKELTTIITETLLIASFTSYILLILFIFSMIDDKVRLVYSVIPFGAGMLLFFTGRIYIYFDENLNKKGNGSVIAKLIRLLFVLPGGKIASVNHDIYKLKPVLFRQQYFFVINGFLVLLRVSFMSAPILLQNYNTYFASTSVKKHKPAKKSVANKETLTTEQPEKPPKNKDTAAEKPDVKKTEDNTTHVASIPKETPVQKPPDATIEKKAEKETFIGKKVKITLKNNFQLTGWVLAESRDNYTLEGFQYGGRFSFSILKEDIAKIAIIPKEQEEKS